MTTSALSTTPNPPTIVDPCLTGKGILCGLEVYLDERWVIHINAGVAITPAGKVIKVEKQQFKLYLLHEDSAIVDYLKGNKLESLEVFELTNHEYRPYEPRENDPLIPQYKTDTPDAFFLEDKVLLLYVDPAEKLHFLLVSLSNAVNILGLDQQLYELEKKQQPTPRRGLFQVNPIQQQWEEEDVEKLLRKTLQLPSVFVRHFGYYQLALANPHRPLDFDDPGTPERLDNLSNPFSKIDAYSKIFYEYKCIVDEAIENLEAALDQLHLLFGATLSFQSAKYLKSYLNLMVEKWNVFLQRGDYYFYVQYFYDWVIDLVKAYNELAEYLNQNMATTCFCLDQNAAEIRHIWLGMVTSSSNSFAEKVFRDHFKAPSGTDGQEAYWRQARFLHWRLLMMIRTFDLPFLKLDQNVLVKFFPQTVEDRDSTDYFERLNVVDTDTKKDIVDFEDLPLKATPTKPCWVSLGDQCIPYYYPLSHSQYSLQQYWNFEKNLLGRGPENLSYNAFWSIKYGAEEKTSYTQIPAVVYPLAHNLRAFPGFKIEGHIGRKIDLFWEGKEVKHKPDNVSESAKLTTNIKNLYFTHLLNDIRIKYNLKIDVILVDASLISKGDTTKIQSPWQQLIGLERKTWIAPGETLVLVYTSQGEQIELDECTADDAPEIEPFTIVADFTLPYLYSDTGNLVVDPNIGIVKIVIPGITIIPYF